MGTLTMHKPRKIADQVGDLLATEFAKGTAKPRTMRDFRALFFPDADSLESRYIWDQVRSHIKNDIRKGGFGVELSGTPSVEDPRVWEWKFTLRSSETTAVTRHAQVSKRGIDIHNSSRGKHLVGANLVGSLQDKRILDRYRDLLTVAEHFEGKAIDSVNLIIDGAADSGTGPEIAA